MSLRERTRPGLGIIEPNMRTASLIMLSGLFVQVAHADEIRHATFPNVMLGTWAETAEQCAAKDKTNIVIEPTKYRDGGGDARYAGSLRRRDRAASITQCIAFALAHRCRRRPKTKTSSCGRLAQIARRWDNRSKI
jgi:hypothetical protein